MAEDNAIVLEDLQEKLRRRPGRRRRLVRRSPRRDLRHGRAQRRGQDDDDRVPRRPAHADLRPGERPRPRSLPPGLRAPGADRRPAPAELAPRPAQDRRDHGPLRRFLREDRPLAADPGRTRPGRKGRRRLRRALRGAEAAPLHRPGPPQRSRGRLPRRADDRPRPAGPPGHVGPGQGHPRARERPSS